MTNSMCGLKLIDSHVESVYHADKDIDYDGLIDNAEEIEEI